MTRDISSDNITASQASVIEPIIFAKLAFDSGTIYVHCGLGTITWGGNDYLGVGYFAGISAVDEDSDFARTPVEISLSGIPSDYISIVLNEYYQGNAATFYLGFIDQSTGALIDDPFVTYQGRMDTAKIEESQELKVSIMIESRAADWDRPRVRRYNNADQQNRFPGDRFFEFVEQTVEKEVFWGQKSR